MRRVIVGSRKSKLALVQTNWVINELKKKDVPFTFEIKEVVTKGDVILDVNLSKVGGKGLFVKEIEQLMLRKEIDLAVHSMKDMPAVLPDGLVVGCTPKRVDPRDVFISKDGSLLEQLQEGAVIGTSSLRRTAQLLSIRPDVQIKWIRGNVDTRLRKLQEEDYDGIILAAAGLKRLGLDKKVTMEYLPVEDYVPAVGQGCLAIECRENDKELIDALRLLHDEYTSKTVEAERVFLKGIEGGCQIPIGGYAILNEKNQIQLTALVASVDGKTMLKEVVVGESPIEVGEEAVKQLIAKGAKELIQAAEEEVSHDQP